jgi:predicted dehydrogenase
MGESLRSPRLRWGVLATGAIARDVVPGLLRSTRNELVAVGSRSHDRSRKFADEHGIERAHASYEELIADPDVDCIYSCLPNALHAEWTRRALDAGKHVLSEKPLTSEPAEAAALFDLAEAKGLHLAEAFMYRHHPKTRILGELVRSGKLGQIHTIRSSFNWWCEEPAGDVRYRPDLAGGSLLDVGTYCVSMSNFIADAEPASARGLAVSASSGVDERFYGTMAYSDGSVALFDCSMRSPLSLGVSVLGTLGEAHLPMPWYAHLDPPTISVHYRDGHEETIHCRGENAYFLETENFAAVVLDGAEPVVPASETLRTLRTVAQLRAHQTVV